MSRIVDNDAHGGWDVFLTPVGADPATGDEDVFVDFHPTLVGAALLLIEALAHQASEQLEGEREHIQAVERRYQRQRRQLRATLTQGAKAEDTRHIFAVVVP